MRLLRKHHNGRRITLDDNSWLVAGHRRFERDMTLHLGSPETMRHGGEDALARGDTAAAVFFFAKAIEIAGDWSVCDHPPYRRGVADDAALFRRYVETLARARMDRPGADVLSGHVGGNGSYTIAIMRAIAARAVRSGGLADGPVGDLAGDLDQAIAHFDAVTAAPAGHASARGAAG
jgi:hypothetical protein